MHAHLTMPRLILALGAAVAVQAACRGSPAPRADGESAAAVDEALRPADTGTVAVPRDSTLTTSGAVSASTTPDEPKPAWGHGGGARPGGTGVSDTANRSPSAGGSPGTSDTASRTSGTSPPGVNDTGRVSPGVPAGGPVRPGLRFPSRARSARPAPPVSRPTPAPQPTAAMPPRSMPAAAREESIAHIPREARAREATAAPRVDVPTALEAVPANADSLAATDSTFTNVRVFYGTTRAREDHPTAERFYGPGDARALEFGIATVTVPLRHRPGEIETRGRTWHTLFLTRDRPNPAKHMLIRSVTPLGDSTWTVTFRQALDSAPSKDLLVYVHGYNNSFSDAALRAAQLVYDVKPGQSIAAMFSWPSRAEPQWYIADEDAVQVAIPAFKRFLLALVDSTGADRVQLVGHSMGTRMIAATLQALAAEGRTSVVSDVVLAAADINAEVFRDQIAPALTRAAGRVTMYTSAGDRALAASRTIHAYQRAGESAAWLSSIAGVDVIDATRAKADWLDHGYVQQNKALLDDMFMLLTRGLPPDRRNLREVARDNLRYWMVP